jgi:hypothetical protein
MLRRLTLLSTAAAALTALALACGTDAVGVDSCKQIEDARCQQAPACGISLANPPHRDPDVEACIRFYDVACLHGLDISADPGAVAVQACVTAIKTNGCNTVVHPETDPACAFLVPPPVDAGIDGPADGADATDDSDDSG